MAKIGQIEKNLNHRWLFIGITRMEHLKMSLNRLVYIQQFMEWDVQLGTMIMMVGLISILQPLV